ncbi:inner centromere protein A isoform X1 [Neodiprion pinetum]|uniref:inner centromere protein A isoform X1 n=2 Tax=Neodiprion pinetum TaxID=441929 RepID=UPI001EE027E2|nr:inner centromere protein A-like isoform X1 [Neodiprion pinetum]
MIYKIMEGWTKEKVFNFLQQQLVDLSEFGKANEKEIEDSLHENLTFLRRLVSQVPDSNNGPLLPKTPKVNRKHPAQRIETIHEDEAVTFEVTRTTSIISAPIEPAETDDEDGKTSTRRSRRTASRQASRSIKQQQSLTLNTKLRRPEAEDESEPQCQEDNVKASSSSENEDYLPLRQSKARKTSIQKKKHGQRATSEMKDSTFVLKLENAHKNSEPEERVSNSKRKRTQERSPSPNLSVESKTFRAHSGEPAAKKANLINETLEKSDIDDTLESSIYEDAIGKPAPIHNSTKIIDVTVTLDRKSRESSKSRELPYPSKANQQSNMNVTVVLDSLLNKAKTQATAHQDRLEDDEDEVGCTPEVKTVTRGILQQGYRSKVDQTTKNTLKSNALFSPYATDSVRKRVQAFEQVVFNSPKPVEVDAPTRLTRTKTRAMAAAAASGNTVQPPQSVQSLAQKLARKSLAKAKRISLAKRVKDVDDSKENENANNTTTKGSTMLTLNEKLMQKQLQRVTPVGKSRLQIPTSLNRMPPTPLSVQPFSNYPKAMSASRTNIIMNVDSFLQSNKRAQKLSLAEKFEEKRRKVHDEDARRKKEEALKIQAEEKKRKREEKELKNKMAREAKEKLDLEKRMKAEKEREEKAKIALQMQEKIREEAEKKRILQLQRAQEKEERRKQEEQIRLQRLQEQEEMERQLAEQKRKEQEAAEKQHLRRLAEAKAQQQAVAEAAKIKAQYQAKGKQHNNTYNVPTQAQGPAAYKIESEPDEDDDTTDNEEAPKHAVPTWANAQVRRGQLALQKYIPIREIYGYFGSRQCTPDLTEIFQGIDKKRLIRTSSAVWKTPPRYSIMYRE